MTFDLQGLYAERGRPMITGAQEVMTLQLSFDGGGGGGGRGARGPLTFRGRTLVRGCPMTTGAQEVTTVDELQLRLSKTVQDYR